MGVESTARERFWRHHVEQYRCGELTLRAYCERHELNRSSFGYWRRRLSEGGEPAPRQAGRALNIVRVDVTDMAVASSLSAPSPFEVVLGNGWCLRIPGDFEAGALERLLGVLERAR